MATTERGNDKVAGWLWQVLIGLSLVFVVLVCWTSYSPEKTMEEGGIASKTSTAPQIIDTIDDVPVGGWSREVNTTGHRKVCWGRIDLTKGGTCEVMLDRDPKMVFPVKAQTGRMGLKTLQFKCSETGARIEVTGSD